MFKIIAKLLIFLICLEVYSRIIVLDRPWYNDPDLIEDARAGKIKYIFLGSSRVMASIIPDEFLSDVGAEGSQEQAWDMGRGSSTLVEHYYGIEKITDVMPNKLNNVVVFLEAPEEFPELSTWDGNWENDEMPELLAMNLDYHELAQFWLDSNTDIEKKLAVTFAKVSNLYKERGVGIALLQLVDNILKTKGILPPEERGDMSGEGGIKTNTDDIQKARNLAISDANRQIANQKLAKHYDKNKYVLYSLNKLIHDNGGRLIIFDMPISSVQQMQYNTVIGQQNKAYIDNCLREWNIKTIRPVIATTDDDFPDLWHLRESRASEFSKTVAESYKKLLQEEKKNITNNAYDN